VVNTVAGKRWHPISPGRFWIPSLLVTLRDRPSAANCHPSGSAQRTREVSHTQQPIGHRALQLGLRTHLALGSRYLGAFVKPLMAIVGGTRVRLNRAPCGPYLGDGTACGSSRYESGTFAAYGVLSGSA
jgi:hypothetical protein